MSPTPIPPAPAGTNVSPPDGAPKVEWALWCARQGFRVFPLRAGAKKPPTILKILDAATRDGGQIRAWWARPGHTDDNPAIYLPDHVALDFDMLDKAGNPTVWRESVKRLGVKGSDLDSAIRVRTRRGFHAIWRRPPDVEIWSKNGIEPHIDLRALGGLGYLVAPGAEVDYQDSEGEWFWTYAIIHQPDEIGVLPAHLLDAIIARQGSKRDRCKSGEVAVGAEIDSDWAVAEARTLIEGWPPSVEGAGGHDNLRALVMQIGDLGVSADTCLDLLLEADGWNELCSPPWELEELDYQVHSMFASRSTPIGCAQSAAQFAGVDVPDCEYAGTGNSGAHGLVTRTFATIEMRAVDWLWLGHIPRGYVTIVAGESGAGKSTVIADVVARITTGAAWPGEAASARRTPGRVLWLGAEDSAAEMTGPRLIACGADLSKVTDIVGSRRDGATATFSMQDDLANVTALLDAAAAKGMPFAMLVIDPVTSYLPGQKLRKVDLNDAGHLRSILEPWLRLAEHYALAIVCVTHFGKDTSRTMVHRVLGSSAFAQTCRSLLAVIQQPPGIDGEVDPFAKALMQVKNNLPDTPGGAWLFRTKRVEVGTDSRNGKPIPATCVEWDKLDKGLTPEKASGAGVDRGHARKDAAFGMWLFAYFQKFDPGAWVDTGELKATAIDEEVVTARWWQEHSPRFLEKRNVDGKWLCRPRSGTMGGAVSTPIESPHEFDPKS